MKLLTFFRLSGTRKQLLLEAVFYSGLYRWQILHRPFSSVSKEFGTFRYETPREELDTALPADVSWALEVMRRHVFWDSQCLDRAAAAKKLLNRRNYPCTLYMGVRLNEKQEMTAHAWLRCGTAFVTGGDGTGYAVTGIFGDRQTDAAEAPQTGNDRK